jgi:histidinol dehydrogenase
MVIYYPSDMELVWKRLKRKSVIDEGIISSVRQIVSDVALCGDAALFKYTKMFDGFELSKDNIRVTKDEIKAAYNEVPEELLDTIKKSAANIEAFHAMQKREGYERNTGGAVTGSLILPMRRAGVYVPGGKAAYPSSVLMNIIPAKTAGVEEIAMVTPPGKTGVIEPLTLVAADIAGADKIFRVGGAQAIAALAYGTESIPKADVITGPGNAYVATAKKEVFGAAGIDMIAGPSEVLIIADDTADPGYIAADLLSQAEHDEKAASVLLTPFREIAERVSAELDVQLDRLPRKGIAEKSIENFGTIVVTSGIDEAFDIANEFAPEHLEILTADPRQYLSKVKNAGAVFLGEYSPEPLGDYFAGPNHVLPTSGTARFSSPLSVDDFVKRTNYVCYDRQSLEACYNDIERFALAEGLDAHARSAAARFDTDSPKNP